MDEGLLATLLQKDGALAPEGLAAARARQRSEGGDLAHNLLEVGAVDESAVLRAVSIAYQTRYVTAEKLAKARISDGVLAMLPERIASQHHLLPIQFDQATRTLSVVLSDPRAETLKAAKDATGARDVRAYVALPETVDAGIRRFYQGDIMAFATLEARFNPRYAEMMQLYQGNLLDEAQLESNSSVGGIGLPTASEKSSSSGPISNALDRWEDSTQPPYAQAQDPRASGEQRRVESTAGRVAVEAYLETVKVLVSLAELGNTPWRHGHSAHVAREARRLGTRLGLDEQALLELTLAAFLHDVGKPDEPHLTLLGISTVPHHRALAERAWQLPAKLLEAAQLPIGVQSALNGIYERVDGEGVPKRRRERDIPLSARILAVVDAFVELTKNPFGAAGGNVVDEASALETLRRGSDTLFDRNLVEIYHQLMSGDDLRQRLLGERPRILLVDPDAEGTAVLDLKLVTEGIEVRIARTAKEALRAMAHWLPDLVMSEVALVPVDGFELLAEMRRHSSTQAVPFFFVSERASAADLDRGFALGASDYVAKPYTLEVLLAKVRRLVFERAQTRESSSERRVTGSLGEMAVADVIEVLSKGRKSGLLRLRSPRSTEHGEVWLDTGMIIHAVAPPDTLGEAALWRLLRLGEGEFLFESGVFPPTRSIDAPTEWLLLEGLRRLDEGT
jgi:response regulator RpfG family c-di-GMP phosphodiesterase